MWDSTLVTIPHLLDFVKRLWAMSAFADSTYIPLDKTFKVCYAPLCQK